MPGPVAGDLLHVKRPRNGPQDGRLLRLRQIYAYDARLERKSQTGRHNELDPCRLRCHQVNQEGSIHGRHHFELQ